MVVVFEVRAECVILSGIGVVVIVRVDGTV